MKKKLQKKGGNVGHDPMYLCFYDHNFPYVVRHFNFKNSFGFAHMRFIFNAAGPVFIKPLKLRFS
jgi:hypothetical protein